MATIRENTGKALRAYLISNYTGAGTLTIAHDNSPFNPSAYVSTGFIRASISWGDSSRQTLAGGGTTSGILDVGVLLIQVFVPRFGGTVAADVQLDTLESIFCEVTMSITGASITTRVPSAVRVGGNDPNFHQANLNIPFRVFRT